jgi:hypothetical protein
MTRVELRDIAEHVGQDVLLIGVSEYGMLEARIP